MCSPWSPRRRLARSTPTSRCSSPSSPKRRIVTWDDHTVDWAAFGAVVLRSTWDYHAHLDRFLDWARSVAAVTALWNPPQLIEWNIDKRYLLELAASGVPIVPTQFVAAGDELPPCGGDIVVKPSVGAGSVGVRRFERRPRRRPRSHRRPPRSRRGGDGAAVPVGDRRPRRDRHGVRRRRRSATRSARSRSWRRPSSGRVEACSPGSRPPPRSPSPAERALGELVVAALPATAYARVDLLPTDDGPVLLELEVIEPSLFLHLDPAAPARAAAVFRNLMP